jgi:DNA invertase Pin-like site-specific DNA recombinase
MKKRNITLTGLIPAAQYIRMSTEHQRFSPDNQKIANMAYAVANGYEIVATYQDSGKSGLTLKGRPELKRLLSDVLGGTMSYRTILVLDVSRWGRFQDADQAAHYEYMCREAGVPVHYCSEAFDNYGGSMASIVKHMKRVMAAEYSRELSNKISKAQRFQAGLGYKQGGYVPFGTRRLVIDRDGKAKNFLEAGETKALSSDRVVLVKGHASEVAIIRRIFSMYVLNDMAIPAICDWLATRKKLGRGGISWNSGMITRVLGNEIYQGTYVFGRRMNNLGQPKFLPPEQWVRSVVLAPMVSDDLFVAASVKLGLRRCAYWSESKLKDGLRRLLLEKGYISAPDVQKAEFLPGPGVFFRRFGGLTNACREIGYDKPLRATGHVTREHSNEQLLEMLTRIRNEKGNISAKIIDADLASPSARYFARRLGGLRKALYQAGLIERVPPPSRSGLKPDGSQYTDDELLEALRQLLAKHGYLTLRLINGDVSVASANTYGTRFRGLTEAYARIGYCQSRSELHKLGWDRRRSRLSSCQPLCD